MGEKKTFELLFYNEKTGAMDVKYIDIHFVSQSFMRQFDELMVIAVEVGENWNKISDNNSMIAAFRANGENAAMIKKYVDENVILSQKINRFAEFPEKRIKLLLDILVKNGITDPELLSQDFWDNYVDSGFQNVLLGQIIRKDIEKKNSPMEGNISPGEINSFPDEAVQH